MPLLFDSSPLLASGVSAGPGTDLLTGADADRSAAAQPERFEPYPKKLIDDGRIWLGERELSVLDLIAAVLARVTDEARRVTGTDVTAATLTHPATWSRTRLSLLASAAQRAGLAEIRLVAEPVAAATYFGTVLGHQVPVGHCVVAYDLGAGTFDVGVVRRESTGFATIASAGLADLGGLDIDCVVVDHARALTADAAGWARLDWPETPADRRARRALWQNARATKEQLSRYAVADLHVPLVEADLHLTRDEFDLAVAPLIERGVGLTLATLREAGVPPEAIAGVFLVGGSSRIPLVASMLHRALRIAPTVIDQPELAVATGCLRVDHPRPHPSASTPPPPAQHAEQRAVATEAETHRPAGGQPLGPDGSPRPVRRVVAIVVAAVGAAITVPATAALLWTILKAYGPATALPVALGQAVVTIGVLRWVRPWRAKRPPLILVVPTIPTVLAAAALVNRAGSTPTERLYQAATVASTLAIILTATVTAACLRRTAPTRR